MRTATAEWVMADLQAECPEAPAVLLQRSVMRAARELSTACLCTAWVDIPTQGEVTHYPFERYLPEHWQVLYVLAVEYNGCCIRQIKDDCGLAYQVGYVLDDLSHITLIGYCPGQVDPKEPDCRDTLRVKVALRPSAEACELPVDMVERFEEELGEGARAYLFAMKNKPWSDANASEYYRNRFLGGIASAKMLAQNGYSPEGHRIEAARVV